MLLPNLITLHDLTFETFITEQKILERVKEISQLLTEQYRDKNPLIISVLNGAFIFAADLMRNMNINCEIEFVKLASYDGLNSSGEVLTILGLNQDLKGKDIIIVEDIVDSGNTMLKFKKQLELFKPASIRLVSLLLKPDALQHDIKIDHLGFEIPDKFVVGYGLDYNGLGRNLRGLYQLV